MLKREGSQVRGLADHQYKSCFDDNNDRIEAVEGGCFQCMPNSKEIQITLLWSWKLASLHTDTICFPNKCVVLRKEGSTSNQQNSIILHYIPESTSLQLNKQNKLVTTKGPENQKQLTKWTSRLLYSYDLSCSRTLGAVGCGSRVDWPHQGIKTVPRKDSSDFLVSYS